MYFLPVLNQLHYPNPISNAIINTNLNKNGKKIGYATYWFLAVNNSPLFPIILPILQVNSSAAKVGANPSTRYTIDSIGFTINEQLVNRLSLIIIKMKSS
jgi:hypothetical protein